MDGVSEKFNELFGGLSGGRSRRSRRSRRYSGGGGEGLRNGTIETKPIRFPPPKMKGGRSRRLRRSRRSRQYSGGNWGSSMSNAYHSAVSGGVAGATGLVNKTGSTAVGVGNQVARPVNGMSKLIGKGKFF